MVASPSLLLLSLAANVNGKMSFKAPNKHDDIELESPNHFYVKHVSDINSDDDARAYINEVKNAVSGGGGSFVAITDQATFDVAYSVALHAKRLSPENFRAFTGVLRTGLTRLLDAIASTELANAMARQSVSTRSVDAFKMYVFLLSVNTKLGLAAIKKESTHDVQVAGQSKRTKKQAFAKKKEVRGRGSARACCLSVSVCVPACARVRACVRVFRDHDVGGGGFGLVVQQFVWRLAVRPLTARLTCSAPPSPAPPRRVHVCMRVCVCVCLCACARGRAQVLAVAEGLDALVCAAKCNFKRFWQMGLPEEDFLKLFTAPALLAFETAPLMLQTTTATATKNDDGDDDAAAAAAAAGTARSAAVALCVRVAALFPTVVVGNLCTALAQQVETQAHAVAAVAEVVAALLKAQERSQARRLSLLLLLAIDIAVGIAAAAAAAAAADVVVL